MDQLQKVTLFMESLFRHPQTSVGKKKKNLSLKGRGEVEVAGESREGQAQSAVGRGREGGAGPQLVKGVLQMEYGGRGGTAGGEGQPFL